MPTYRIKAQAVEAVQVSIYAADGTGITYTGESMMLVKYQCGSDFLMSCEEFDKLFEFDWSDSPEDTSDFARLGLTRKQVEDGTPLMGKYLDIEYRVYHLTNAPPPSSRCWYWQVDDLGKGGRCSTLDLSSLTAKQKANIRRK